MGISKVLLCAAIGVGLAFTAATAAKKTVLLSETSYDNDVSNAKTEYYYDSYGVNTHDTLSEVKSGSWYKAYFQTKSYMNGRLSKRVKKSLNLMKTPRDSNMYGYDANGKVIADTFVFLSVNWIQITNYTRDEQGRILADTMQGRNYKSSADTSWHLKDCRAYGYGATHDTVHSFVFDSLGVAVKTGISIREKNASGEGYASAKSYNAAGDVVTGQSRNDYDANGRLVKASSLNAAGDTVYGYTTYVYGDIDVGIIYGAAGMKPAASGPISMVALYRAGNGRLDMSFELSASANVSVRLCDAAGRQVAKLAEGRFAAGRVEMNGVANVGVGKYIVQIKAGNQTVTRKVVLN